MKKKIHFSLTFLLLVVLVLPCFVLAGTTPTSKAEFEAAFASTNEQLFGYNHLGGPGLVEEPLDLILGPYSYQMSTVLDTNPGAAPGYYNDSENISVNSADRIMVLSFSDPLPKSLCLGVIAVDPNGIYLANQSLSISLNGGDWRTYHTPGDFADAAYILQDPAGISQVRISRTTNYPIWYGLSYLLLPAKLEQHAPPAPVVASGTDTSITLEEIPGAQYKLGDGGVWQSGLTFAGLQPGTEYSFFAYYPESETHHASLASGGTLAGTEKSEQAPPAAPVVSDLAANSVTLEIIAGAEYRVNDGAWQTDSTFAGLQPATAYTFYARFPETATSFASFAGEGTTVTTISQILRTLTHTPSGVSIMGRIHVNAELQVEEGALDNPGACDACDAIRDRLSDDTYILLSFYNISLTEAFGGELELAIPVGASYDGKIVTILHCANGVLKSYTATVEGGAATFVVTELSPFAVFVEVEEAEEAVVEIPDTGESNILPVSGFLCLGMAGCLLRLRSRRKEPQ